MGRLSAARRLRPERKECGGEETHSEETTSDRHSRPNLASFAAARTTGPATAQLPAMRTRIAASTACLLTTLPAIAPNPDSQSLPEPRALIRREIMIAVTDATSAIVMTALLPEAARDPDLRDAPEARDSIAALPARPIGLTIAASAMTGDRIAIILLALTSRLLLHLPTRRPTPITRTPLTLQLPTLRRLITAPGSREADRDPDPDRRPDEDHRSHRLEDTHKQEKEMRRS